MNASGQSGGTTTTESYTYDAVGNRLSASTVPQWNYNSSNELTSTSLASFTYDGNGNTVSKALSSGTTQYAWDFENRLSSAALPGTGGSVTFKYDPFGRRIQKAFTQGTTTTTTNYLYDGASDIEELDQNGNLLARYTQGAGIDEPLAEFRSSTVSYYEQDGLGSVTSLSGSTGALLNTYIYKAFGNLASSSGSTVNPFQYTGRDYDAETGLHYYRARYYDGNLGRFLSEDPAAFDYDQNFYRYVSDNPANLIDPDGNRGVPPKKPAPKAPPVCPFSIDSFIGWLDDNAGGKPTGHCATFIRKALQAGLGQTPTDDNALGSPVPTKDWGPFLGNIGFDPVSLPTDTDGSVTYEPVAGDIVIFQPVEGSNQNGHIQAFDGTQFISDYLQGPPLSNGAHFYPNLGRNGPQPFQVYRHRHCN